MSKRKVSDESCNQAFCLAYASLDITRHQRRQLQEPNPQESVKMSTAATAALPRINQTSAELLALEEVIKSEMKLITALRTIYE